MGRTNDRGLKEEKAPPSVETSTNCGIDTRNADGLVLLRSALIPQGSLYDDSKFLPIEMQLTYQVDGEPLEWLPDGYSDHYVPNGFEMDDVQKILSEQKNFFLHVLLVKKKQRKATQSVAQLSSQGSSPCLIMSIQCTKP